MMNKILYSLLLSLFSYTSLLAQCMLFEIPLTDRIEESTHIMEGKVIAKRSFWDDSRSNIFTANKIEIYKSLKGSLVTDYVEILTRGGYVGLEGQSDHPSLQLKEGDTGIFFLTTNMENVAENRVSGIEIFQPASGPQGFLKYDLKNGVASDPFQTYEQVDPDLYELIEKATQHKYVTVSDFQFKKEVQKPNLNKVLAFTFSPATVTAGTDAVLTISDAGGGLGSMGVIRFSNADNGGASIDVEPLTIEVCSWTTTEIKVQVPDGTCTGNFEVEPNGMGTITSSTPLVVTYAQSNAFSSFVPPLNSYQTQHRDDDGEGGYTWQRFTDFASSSGAAPFLRALESWCGGTNIYWTIGANTTVDIIASDGVNVVRFDNGPELPGGVLGRCTSRWSGCTTGSTKDCETGVGTPALLWYVSELDIVFNDGTNWNYGPGPTTGSQYDFESVAIHELGHGHQLGHINDGTAVMHYSISNASDKRNLNANELAGAADVYLRSTTSPVCGSPLMATDINCLALLPVELLDFTIKKNSHSVELNWRTASETNNAYFSLERSLEGRSFTELGTVTGAGNSSEEKSYSFVDRAPGAGTNYYRLKQVDYDGNYTYSNVRSADFFIDKEQFIVYPNPLEGSALNVFFSSPSDLDKAVTLEIIDVKGTQLLQQKTFLEKNVVQMQLSLNDFPAGVYWLRFNVGQNTYVEKVVKF